MAVATEAPTVLRDVGIPGLTENLPILSKEEVSYCGLSMIVTGFGILAYPSEKNACRCNSRSR